MKAYVNIAKGVPTYSLPMCEVGMERHFLLVNYMRKYLPLRDRRVPLKEFFDIVEKKGHTCPNKEKLLQWLQEML